MFAGHHRLANLCVVVDHNHQQAFGHTFDILESHDMVARWRAFGWDVVEADGHDEEGLVQILRRPRTGRPQAVVAETTFGKGVSYMEGQIKWHYFPMSDEEYEQALREIGGVK